MYKGKVKPVDKKYIAIITEDDAEVSSYMCDDETTAKIWVDDEIARLTTGKGVWDE